MAFSCTDDTTVQTRNSNFMWFDCEANYERLSYPDSIMFYLQKCKDAGFDNVVVDVKSIMGEVLYDSRIAPYMGEWDGWYRRQDYDMLSWFIKYGHRLGMKVYASLNIFAGGHNWYDRGIIYKEHPEWQSIVYDGGELKPISEIKSNYNGMLNPANPEVRQYQLDILDEFARKYKDLDGIIFDRVRYDGITSDFSDLSRQMFEEYAGVKVDRFPEDILYWEKDPDSGEWKYSEGRHFLKWVEWRASVIKNFISDAHALLKGINPDLEIGDYTGAWYPTYYQLGVNWASVKYDPSAEYSWATPEYRNTGYAELLDLYMTGLYYTLVTKADVDAATGVAGPRTEAAMDNSLTYCYSVEGGAELVRRITCGAAPVIGSLYVEQYKDDWSGFTRAVRQVLEDTDGLMVFDIVHIINHGLWDELESAVKNKVEE
ncbi:MAG TPA: family 10 glycosylhydrolase [Candidatus Cryptobacteroides intestinipullorum]|nr:family 10 glycosylhydrolase [Candidatus Cryptobacteroides intestinipullorum]